MVDTFARADDKVAAVPADMTAYTETIPGTDVKFKMVPIPGGVFKMGSPDAEAKRGKDEGPQVQVKVEPFYMEEHEVTWAEYEQFLGNYQRLAAAALVAIPADKWADAVTYPTPLYELEAGPILDRMGRGGTYPAVIMSHHAAKQYCKWLSKRTGRFYRLPTEAEWEYAARAGTTTAYSFGDSPKQLEDYAWDFDNSPLQDGEGAYRKVKEKKPNPWGLYDMHGNVGEWCLDEYQEDWYKQLAAKGGVVSVKDAIRWPEGKTAHPRVIRGGGWESEAEQLRSAARTPSNKNMNKKDPQLPQSPYWLTEGFWIGFRVVSPVQQPPEAERIKYWDADNEATKMTTMRDRDRHEIVMPGAGAPQARAAAGK
jgi:formylglycine-generating enzyme required for sulfatase activity